MSLVLFVVFNIGSNGFDGFLILPTDSTENTNFFFLSPDEPNEPDGWRNVLFSSTDCTDLFFCVFCVFCCLSIHLAKSGLSGDYT